MKKLPECCPTIEPVESATFPLPGREDLGDFTSGRLLPDTARLSTRAAADSFRWSYVTWRLTISSARMASRMMMRTCNGLAKLAISWMTLTP